MIKPETIEAVLDTARIEEVVGDFVTLKRRGVNMIGLCPFHNEKTPSFIVSPSKGIYKCFGCGKAGNSVNFVMEHEHYSYPDAIRYLAAKYRIPIVETEKSEEDSLVDDVKDRLFNINSFAQKYFSDILLNTDSGKAIGLSYFKNRGFNQTSIETFQLGYCIDKYDEAVKHFRNNGYKDDILTSSGIAVAYDDGKLLDRFRGRVMFPIHNLTGRVIGFGGRILGTSKNVAKYLNSPENEIYHKSDTLYGIFFAKKSILAKDFCYLVEGYMDVITMYQAGFTNVVASSGTSLTKKQILLIKRFTNNVTVIYDGDSAGIKASLRGIDMILAEGLSVRVISLPENDDPDSFIKNNRISDVIDYFDNNQVDFITFKANLLLKDAGNDPIKKADVVKNIVSSIAVIPDAIYRSTYIKECASLLEVSEQSIIYTINNIISKEVLKTNKPVAVGDVKPEKPQINTDVFGSDLDVYEKSIIEKLLLYGDLKRDYYADNQDVEDDNSNEIYTAQFIIEELEADDISFSNPIYKKILDIYKIGIEQGVVPEQKLFVNNEDEAIAKVAIDIISFPYTISDKWKEMNVYVKMETDDIVDTIIKTLLNFKSAWIKRLREKLQLEMKNTTDEVKMYELLMTDKQYKEAEIAIDKELKRVISSF